MTTWTIGAVALIAVLLGALAFSRAKGTRNQAALERERDRHRVTSLMESRFRALIQESHDWIAILEGDGTIRYASPACRMMLGREPGVMARTNLIDIVHEADIERLLDFEAGVHKAELRLQHADGSWKHVEVTLTDRRGDQVVDGIVLNAHDVTERQEWEERLRHEASHDALTALPNRALFQDRLSRAIVSRSTRASGLAVPFIDLDDFKDVNDTYGHEAGDQLLQGVADRIRECLRPEDTPARFGGDEFAALLEAVASAADAVEVGRRLLVSLSEPLLIAGQKLVPHASVGIPIDTGRELDPDTLLARADEAMYLAKRNGKGTYAVYPAHGDKPVAHRTA